MENINMLNNLFSLLDAETLKPPALCLYIRLWHLGISHAFEPTQGFAKRVGLHPRTLLGYCNQLVDVNLLRRGPEGYVVTHWDALKGPLVPPGLTQTTAQV